MKKILICLLILLLPFNVCAETKLPHENLNEVMESEGITFNHPDYKEEEDKVNVYLFRGKGCTHCKRFLTFIESITEEYGKYFNLISYEVWYNEENAALMENVKEYLHVYKDGVPFIVIGDNKYIGFGDADGEKIKKAIMDEYNSKKRYDVLVEMNKPEKTDSKIIFISLSLCIIAAYIIKSELDKRKILESINELKKGM